MDKHIAEMKNELSYFNAAVKDAAAIREANGRRYQPEYAAAENARLEDTVAQLYRETRGKIEAIHARAVAAVNAWAKLDGAKIDPADMVLLEGDFPLTTAELRSMLLKHEGNRTMIARVMQYAEEHEIQFQLGYVPTPEDKLAVYDAFKTSAISLLDTIRCSGGITDSMMGAFGDPSHVTDPRFVCVLCGLEALQKGVETPGAAHANGEFAFHFKPLPGREKA